MALGEVPDDGAGVGAGAIGEEAVAGWARPDVPHIVDEVRLDERRAVRRGDGGVRVRMPALLRGHGGRLLDQVKAAVEQTVIDEVSDRGPVRDETGADEGRNDIVLLALDDEQRHLPCPLAHLGPRLTCGVLRWRGVWVVRVHLIQTVLATRHRCRGRKDIRIGHGEDDGGPSTRGGAGDVHMVRVRVVRLDHL